MKVSIILLHSLFKLKYFVHIESLLCSMSCATSEFLAWKTVWEWREPWVPQELCTDTFLIHHCLCSFFRVLRNTLNGQKLPQFYQYTILGITVIPL